MPPPYLLREKKVDEAPVLGNPTHVLGHDGNGKFGRFPKTVFASEADGQKARSALQSLEEGPGVQVDSTDPQRPRISFFGVGSGTVTSVDASTPVGLSVAGGPITVSGTLAFTWSAGYQGYTAAEATKLSGIATGATANQTNAYLLDRTNHTGTQAESTITNLVSDLAAKAPVNNAAFTGTTSVAADPTTALQVATKQYVDGLIANIGKRSRVRAATTANITISTALNNADTLDGVTLATGDLVLVKNQTAPAENGIYVVGVTPARSPEYDTYNEYSGSLIAVEEGSTNADTLWLCTANDGGTLGTTAISFSKMIIAGELLAANNLSDVAVALTAFNNIKQSATTSYAGVSQFATTAQYIANTAGYTLTTDQVWAAAVQVAGGNMTGATTVDFSTWVGASRKNTITGNTTLGATSNIKKGHSFVWEITQDGTGSRTLSLNSTYWVTAGGAGITLSTAASAKDVLTGYIQDDGKVLLSIAAKAVA